MMGNPWLSGKRICLPMQEMWVQFLGQEDPWSRKWQPTLVFLLEKFHGQRSLTGYRVHGVAESDTTEHTHAQSLRAELCAVGGEKVIGTKGVKELRDQKIRWWMLKSLRMVIKKQWTRVKQ